LSATRGARADRRAWLARLVPLAALLITAVLRLLRATVRSRFVYGEDLFARWERGERVILAFWHDRLVLMAFGNRWAQRFCIMVSRHRDGELISRAVRPLAIDTVRGSSTRGWSGALKGLLRAFRSGSNLAFACDGPRGPRWVAKSGVVQVARATGAVIVPVGAAARWGRRLGSWDRLIVPLPGSRVVYLGGRTIAVPPDADAATIERIRLELEAELARVTDAAEAVLDAAVTP
jgi:lysophospholipid acyltransferase (LPLAT)-like uncharacterized protein